MTDFQLDILNNYIELDILADKISEDGSKIVLVKDRRDDKIYIKKILKQFDKDVLLELKKLAASCDDFLGVYRIPEVFHLFFDEDEAIVIESYINSQNLEKYIDTNPMTVSKLLDIYISLCDIIYNIHSLTPPLIHRDIKPSNILLDSNGTVYLIDFNASRKYDSNEKRERDTKLMGTVGFAAPEQYGFGQSDIRTDVYGIGASLLFCINRIEENLEDVEYDSEQRLIKNLDRVIEKCKSIDAANRYQNIGELRDALVDAKKNATKINKKNAVNSKSKDIITVLIVSFIGIIVALVFGSLMGSGVKLLFEIGIAVAFSFVFSYVYFQRERIANSFFPGLIVTKRNRVLIYLAAFSLLAGLFIVISIGLQVSIMN